MDPRTGVPDPVTQVVDGARGCRIQQGGARPWRWWRFPVATEGGRELVRRGRRTEKGERGRRGRHWPAVEGLAGGEAPATDECRAAEELGSGSPSPGLELGEQGRRGAGLKAQIGARAGLERAWRRGVMWARGGDVAASRWLRALLERRLATQGTPSGEMVVAGAGN